MPFQFTHPGRGATFAGPRGSYCHSGFNSRTPGGVRLSKVRILIMRLRFQFTHPGRGATQTEHTNSRTLGVSIHAPREGCDVCWLVVVAYDNVSIHAPREGCDGTPLRRSARGRSFNSRTPGGVRLPSSVDLLTPLRVSIHAPREGCDACYPRRFLRLIRFQFTHPGRGATLKSVTEHIQQAGFNSRTPGGVRPGRWSLS